MTSTRFTTSGGVNIEKSMTPLDDKQALHIWIDHLIARIAIMLINLTQRLDLFN